MPGHPWLSLHVWTQYAYWDSVLARLLRFFVSKRLVLNTRVSPSTYWQAEQAAPGGTCLAGTWFHF